MPNYKQQRRGSSASVLQMIQMLDTHAADIQDDGATMLLGIAAKALAQLQSHSDRVAAEAMLWQDKYEKMEELYHDEVEKNVDLEEENSVLLFKCQQLEATDERLLNDNEDVADEKEQLECDEAFLEAAPKCVTPAKSTSVSSFSFSDDIYGQLDQFEHSLNAELEEFEELGYVGSPSNVAKATPSNSKSNRAFSPCNEVLLSKTPYMVSPLQDKTPEASKDTASASNLNPLQLFQRMFLSQADDEPMPAMTTSDSLFSLSSDCSINTVTPMKRTMKMSPQPNAEWAIIE